MSTVSLLTISDTSHELAQLRPDHPQADPVPDASEVVNIQRLASLRLLVGWPPVVLSLHPGIDAHVERLVQPRAPGASHHDLVAAVLRLTR